MPPCGRRPSCRPLGAPLPPDPRAPMTQEERLSPAARGALVLRLESEAIARLGARFGDAAPAAAFESAVAAMLACPGQVVVTGMGKAGVVGQKVSATLASTGTPSFFLHPSEALHGDLGRLRPGDVVLALSNSGETEEVNQVMAACRKLGNPLIGMTGRPDSTLGRHADHVLDIGRVEEACPLKLAPTASTTVMLALGDALAMAVLEERDFGPRDYAQFHPAGSLGRRLMRVDEVMRKGDAVPLVRAGTSVADALIQTSRTKGRPGASIVVEGRMVFWRACRGAGTRAPTTTQERRRAARRMASSGPTVRVAALHRALRMASGAGVARRKSIEARVRSTTTSCLGNSAYGLGPGRQTPGRDQF